MNADKTLKKHSKRDSCAQTASSAKTIQQTTANQERFDKLCSPRGHGFAAEDANTLYDRILCRDAKVIGDDNAKNGADRLVDGMLIQTKYCQSASDSVAAAFEHGKYRYVTPEGAVMDLEVPADQYEKAVELMAERIRRGEIPGVTDPAKAKEIVRKGHFTYAQAKNIAKFGTIESLTYDAAQGAVICGTACGITAMLTFIQSMWSGYEPQTALENAACAGLQVGGAAFLASVVGSQLMRTGLRSALTKFTGAVTKLIGPKLSAELLKLLKPGTVLAGAEAMHSLSKVLRGNILTTALTATFLAGPEIVNACRGRISGKQLFKNMVKSAGGIAGGTGGYMAGSYVLSLIPGAGPVLGFVVPAGVAIAGSIGGEAAGRGIAGQFAEDDAVEMVKIIEDVFAERAAEYLLSEEEVEIIADDLASAVGGETLLNMYASSDRESFATDLADGIIHRLIRNRCGCFVFRLSDADWLQALNAVADGALDLKSIGTQPDPVEAGRQLLGRDLNPKAARKGMYAAKQMNMRLSQSEMRLAQMVQDERQYAQDMSKIKEERNDMIREINELMGELFS